MRRLRSSFAAASLVIAVVAACHPAINSPQTRKKCVDSTLEATPKMDQRDAVQLCTCVYAEASQAGFTDDADMSVTDYKRFGADCAIRKNCVEEALRVNPNLPKEKLQTVCGCV